MFGGNDDNAQGMQGNDDAAHQAPQDDTLNGVTDLVGGEVSPAPTYNSGGFMPTPSEPAQDSAPASDEHHDLPEPTAAPSDNPLPSGDGDNHDLLELKQQALQQLSPLVGQLDQSPEEKFRTLMMLIQASDNQSLLKDAYDAAGQIADEKTKAQALLDVVNEINYFTQKPQAEHEA